MRTVRCADCGAQQPMGSSFELSGLMLCEGCAKKRYEAAGGKLEGLQRAVDPTICARCKMDQGNTELSIMKGLPLCQPCAEKVLNPSFPGWVKLAVAAMLALAGVSMARNWRFFQAYVEVQHGRREAQANRYHRAHELVSSAAQRVPEHPELGHVAQAYEAYAAAEDGDYETAHRLLVEVAKAYDSDPDINSAVRLMSAMRNVKRAHAELKKGNAEQAVALVDQALKESPRADIRLLREIFRVFDLIENHRSEEALALVKRLASENPDEKEMLDKLAVGAEIGMAFDNKDYDTFLAKARTVQAAEPNSPSAVAQVASALACKYAVTGDESYKTQALGALDRAKTLAVDDDDKTQAKEYEERILHRLNTREIISRKEYNRRFRSAASQPAGG